MRQGLAVVGMVLAASAGLSAAPAWGDDYLERMLRGESALQGKKLEKAIEKAEEHPLGSKANPVRVTMPQGQRLYLSRLRCSDGQAPQFFRAGNVGPGPFGNIVDLYKVTCPGAEPAASDIYMDMYHGGFIESRTVPGFGGDAQVPAPAPAPVPAPAPAETPVKAAEPVSDPTG
jgi:hypothetical protein